MFFVGEGGGCAVNPLVECGPEEGVVCGAAVFF